MQVTLLHHTPLEVCRTAIRTCWDSHSKSDDMGEKDLELISRVALQYHHESVLEHLNYTFFIKGCSRAILQELARHRHASMSVKSTRYTLKELKGIKPFKNGKMELDEDSLRKFLKWSENKYVNYCNAIALQNLALLMEAKEPITLDVLKYALPEAYLTELTYSINARSLRNMFSLRTSSKALLEFRQLCRAIYDAIPLEQSFLFSEYFNESVQPL